MGLPSCSLIAEAAVAGPGQSGRSFGSQERSWAGQRSCRRLNGVVGQKAHRIGCNRARLRSDMSCELAIFSATGARGGRTGSMSNTIDCSRMSDVSCVEGEQEGEMPHAPAAAPSNEAAGTSSGVALLRDADGRAAAGASYECINDCVSSLGVTSLLSGATATLGCLMVPPACAIFVGAGVGSILGACEVACEDLESRP
jgi:hypothetical protein